MYLDSSDNLSPSIVRRLRYLEWLFLTVHLILSTSSGNNQLGLSFFVYSVFVVYSFNFNRDRSLKWRQVYVVSAMLSIVGANFADVSLDMLLYLYIAKSFFLIGGKKTIWLTSLTGMGWIASEYYSEMKELERINSVNFKPPFGVGDYSPQSILIFSLVLYVAVSIFIIFFCSVIVAEYKSRKQAEALAEQVEVLAINLERTRIARDIHDSLGHTLTNLDIQLKVARKLCDRDLNKALQAMDKASLLSTQCIEEVSHAVQTMRRNDFDLNRALENLVEQIRNERAVQIQWEINLPQLNLSTSHQIYCVVKEGLINIQKHSAASKVLFQGYSTATEIILKLNDNGVGFDPQKVTSGFGLQGILERVQAIEGRLEIESAPGKGTQISVTIPQ